MATKEVETTIVKLEVADFILEAEGIADETSEWTITMTTPATGYSKSWTLTRYLWEDEVEDFIWEEANAIIRKYATLTYASGLIETEEED